MSDSAKEKYGYAIENNKLPISEELIKELNNLEEEYATYLDWDNPQSGSLWTKEEKNSFLDKANVTYEKLKTELGIDFELENEVYLCVE